MFLTTEISTKPVFLLLWLQWEAHVHFDLGFVMFNKLLASCVQARVALGCRRPSLLISNLMTRLVKY